MASQISQAIKQICDEKNIAYDSVIHTIEAALAAAYRKDFGNKNQNIQVEFDPEKYDGATGGVRVFDVKEVVEDMELPEPSLEEVPEKKVYVDESETIRAIANEFKNRDRVQEPTEGTEEDEGPKFNPKTMIMIRDARDIKPDAQIGEEIRVELSIPASFGRMAAQTAKQVIMQKLREAERGVIFEDFKSREGELMNVTVQRREGRVVLIDLGRATGVLLPEDQIEYERYYPGTRLKALLREVDMTPKGPEIRLSRSSPELVGALFAQEIPEIANGIVIIKSIAREAGSRTKVAVSTNDDAIDPIGSCIGQRGTRIQSVIRELGGEKVDVILWSEDTSAYIAAALSPAEVDAVEIDEESRIASVSVGSDQLSLAIGKGGQNVRLAAKLTNWKITIREEGGTVMADSDIGQILPVNEEEEGEGLSIEETTALPEEPKVEQDVQVEESVAQDADEEKKEVLAADVLDEHGEKAERAEDADKNPDSE